MQVIKVDQAATLSRGKIIFGMTLPCIRMKIGHFECLSISRGPCCIDQLALLPIISQASESTTYKIPLQFTRVAAVQMEHRVARVSQMLHEGRPRCEPPGGVLLLQVMGGSVGMGVCVSANIGGDGGSGAVTSDSRRSVRWRGAMSVGHGEYQKKNENAMKRTLGRDRSVWFATSVE